MPPGSHFSSKNANFSKIFEKILWKNLGWSFGKILNKFFICDAKKGVFRASLKSREAIKGPCRSAPFFEVFKKLVNFFDFDYLEGVIW